MARFDHGHLEHLLDDSDPVSVHDVISVVDPRRGDEVRHRDPLGDFFAGEDAHELDFGYEVDDLAELAARSDDTRALGPTRADNVSAQEALVAEGRVCFEDLGPFAVRGQDLEVAGGKLQGGEQSRVSLVQRVMERRPVLSSRV